MKQIQPDLWETATEHPAPGLTTHAYLLTREDGNVLFYNTGNRREIRALEKLGGVSYQYLSHLDELGESLVEIHERYGARLAGHVAECDEFARYRAPDIVFEQRGKHLGNIEVIPTPGHSPGSTCFLVHSPHGRRYLFTGDTLYRSGDGGWRAGFIPGHTSPDEIPVLAASIRSLGELAPDVVLSSAFSGSSGYQELEPGEWAGIVDRAVDGLLRKPLAKAG